MKLRLKAISATVLMLVCAIVLITACQKTSSSTNTPNTSDNSAANMSANGATSDNAFDDAFSIALQAGNSQGLTSIEQEKPGAATLGFSPASPYYCATLTLKPTPGTKYPDTLVVDFGAGCTSADSVTRSGSITYIFTGPLSLPGSSISATFNNYKVNNYGLLGTYSISNTTTNINSPSLTTAVSQGSITYPNDTSYSFSGTKTVVLASGSITNVASLVFNITGGYTVSNSFGESLTATVTTALVRQETCKHIVSGITSFTYKNSSNNSLNGTIDYGNGTCDDLALISIGSFSETVTLP